jgi:hypothetical protein
MIGYWNKFIYRIVGYEVLTPVVMKNFIFWDATPCNPLEVNLTFSGLCGIITQKIELTFYNLWYNKF